MILDILRPLWLTESWRTSWRGGDWGTFGRSRRGRGHHYLLRILWHQESKLTKTSLCKSSKVFGQNDPRSRRSFSYLHLMDLSQSKYEIKYHAICFIWWQKVSERHPVANSGITPEKMSRQTEGIFFRKYLVQTTSSRYNQVLNERCQLVMWALS